MWLICQPNGITKSNYRAAAAKELCANECLNQAGAQLHAPLIHSNSCRTTRQEPIANGPTCSDRKLCSRIVQAQLKGVGVPSYLRKADQGCCQATAMSVGPLDS